eukprot:TRINITY_DN47377_c0_g1_i1.p1 TRINITY_DN47377_c0_g1~~TRINITY_DN47377_c0_g1_i1.p1  ORF type:complete len:790 (+),score=254.45 TRINITY_DN47377_c0_g1_i1:50-2371(+)
MAGDDGRLETPAAPELPAPPSRRHTVPIDPADLGAEVCSTASSHPAATRSSLNDLRHEPGVGAEVPRVGRRRRRGSPTSSGGSPPPFRAMSVHDRTSSHVNEDMRLARDPEFSIFDVLSPTERVLDLPYVDLFRSGRSLDAQVDLEGFDLTPDHIQAVFDRYDGDEDGKVPLDDLEAFIQEYNFHVGPEGLEKLQAQFDADEDGMLSVQDMTCLLKELVLAQLFRSGTVSFPLGLIDYGPKRNQCSPTVVVPGGADDDSRSANRQLSSGAPLLGESAGAARQSRTRLSVFSQVPMAPGLVSAKEFFFRHRPVDRQKPMRWVHLDATQGLAREGTEELRRQSMLQLLRLVVKYGLHPLSAEDALDTSTPTKVDVIQGHFFLCAEVVALVRKDTGTSSRWEECEHHSQEAPPPVALCRSRIAVFTAGANRDTVITVHSPAGKSKTLFSRLQLAGCNLADRGAGTAWRGMFHELRLELEREPRRMVREKGSGFLLYRILHRTVNELRPVIEAYAARLAYFHTEIRRHRHHFRSEFREELSEVKLELTDLQRIARPLQKVAVQFAENARGMVEEDTRVYFEDVEDTVERVREDIDAMIRLAEAIEDRFQRDTDRSNNKLFLIFTTIATVFLPGQFLAGVYGMNFVDDDGPTIPELTWRHGYAWFWVCALTLSVLTFTLSMLMYHPPRCCREWRARRRAAEQPHAPHTPHAPHRVDPEEPLDDLEPRTHLHSGLTSRTISDEECVGVTVPLLNETARSADRSPHSGLPVTPTPAKQRK